MKKKLFYYTVLLWIAAFFPKSVSAQFAELVYLQHYCVENPGAIEFELNGPPGFYTFYWLPNGEQTLEITGLNPGVYTLVVQNQYGCVEEYPVEVLYLNGCYINSSVEPVDGNLCYTIVEIEVINGTTGLPIDEAALNIQWSDGVVGGLTRTIYVGGGFSYFLSVTVSANGASSCCSDSESFLLPGNPNCKIKKKIIVNEFNKFSDGSGQFVELLVIGNGECDSTMDIRGFHIDDNNGLLIPGSNLVSENNNQVIGVNDGSLLFAYHSNWENVPNGSLILIYDPSMPRPVNFPAIDPTDANQDGVYILLASDQNYLVGKTSTWNNFLNIAEYVGYFQLPDWEAISISDDADGLQVRNPDGTYSHGISSGLSSFSATNNFPLWIATTSTSDCNCHLSGTDYLNKLEFNCASSSNSTPTPGAPNSIANMDLITGLLDCGGRLKQQGSDQTGSKSTEQINVYPNPFDDGFTVDFHSIVSGSAIIKIKDISGREVYQTTVDCVPGGNQKVLHFGQNLPAGVFLLSLKFPSGAEEHVRLLKVNH